MNRYFSSIGKELADKISTVSNPLLSGSFVVSKSNAKFPFKAIQVQEIRNHWLRSKLQKALGLMTSRASF